MGIAVNEKNSNFIERHKSRLIHLGKVFFDLEYSFYKGWYKFIDKSVAANLGKVKSFYTGLN